MYHERQVAKRAAMGGRLITYLYNQEVSSLAKELESSINKEFYPAVKDATAVPASSFKDLNASFNKDLNASFNKDLNASFNKDVATPFLVTDILEDPYRNIFFLSTILDMCF